MLVLDRDPLFSSTYIRSFAQRLGIHLAIASARSQQTNGLAERTIATVEEVLRTRIDLRQQTWPALLPELVFSLNNQPLELFNGKSSLFCEKGVRPLVPVDLMEQLQRADRKNAVVQPVQDKKEALAAERIKTMVETRKQMTEEIHKSQQSFSKHYDKTKRVVDEALKPGAKVWLRFEGFELDGLKLKGTKEKLRPRFVGPFLVVEQISPVSFRIKLPQSKIDSGLHDVFHVRNLLVDKPNAKSILPPEKFESTMNEQEYEMHSVITHDKHGKQNRFLIRWKNWPEALATTFTGMRSLRDSKHETLHARQSPCRSTTSPMWLHVYVRALQSIARVLFRRRGAQPQKSGGVFPQGGRDAAAGHA